jgi:Arc/MetJ family transcription regulator
MRIEISDELVAQIDKLTGSQGRSAFVRSAIERAIHQEFRWADLEATHGAIAGHDHDWDPDPAAWVRQQRRAAKAHSSFEG